MSQNLGTRQTNEGRVLSRDAEDTTLRDLMVQYQEGSLEAFRELYSRLAPDLRRYVRFLTRGSDATDDFLQDAFLQLHRSRAAYNPAYAVRPWIFGLARNVCLMKRRAMRRWASVHSVMGGDLPDVPVPADVERLADTDAIRRCLAALPADHAEALTLHHVWGFSFDEIAGMLGVSAVAARARASRGMARLRAELQRISSSTP
jgi:RNA polymerase sigma-70 factor (ECF subfamily)